MTNYFINQNFSEMRQHYFVENIMKGGVRPLPTLGVLCCFIHHDRASEGASVEVPATRKAPIRKRNRSACLMVPVTLGVIT